MPGPGGGSRGGGGGRGGFGGGSRGGFGGGPRGGFGGGPHFGGPHFHGPRFYGPHFGRRRVYYGGGSCLGGLVGMVVAPIVFVIIAAVILFSAIGGSVVMYDEDTMQDYAYAQYLAEFGAPEAVDAYEDNLLLVFLTNETATDYYYIAFVGDNIRDEVSDLFGNEYTELGRTLSYEIPMDFEYSLSSDLAVVMEQMATDVARLGLETPFYETTDHSGAVEPHLTNHSALPLNEATVERGLVTFTEQTGIPAVIVVDSMERVFATDDGEGSGVVSIVLPILFAIVLVVVAVVIVRAMRRRDKGTNPSDNQYAPNNSNRDDGQL